MAEKAMLERSDNEKSASSPPATRSYFPPSQRKVHDSDVTFEEYYYYAQRTREEQRQLPSPVWQWRAVFSRKKIADPAEEEHKSEPRVGSVITEDEWSNASRAFRTASWGAIFYLVSSFSMAYCSELIVLDHHRYPWPVCCPILYRYPRVRPRLWHLHGVRNHQCL